MTQPRELELSPTLLAIAYGRILDGVEFDTNGGCWLWSGASASGYGKIHLRKVSEAPLLCHRLSYLATGKSLQPGELVLHRCDVRACCNPAHLFAGSHKVNSQDMAQKGRQWQQKERGRYLGEGNPNLRLTDAQVVMIRKARAAGRTLASIAAEFGVSVGHVHRLCAGKQRLNV